MKKLLFITVALLFPFAMTAEGGDAPGETNSMVYICTGGSSKRYHSHPDCTGLNNCQGSIRQISLQKAREMGRTPCQRCY